MKKLNSFAEFSAAKTKIVAAQLEEEQTTKRSNEAETFTSLLADFGVTAIKELSEDQKVKFFEKLRGAGVNESIALIEEGTSGQFGKIDKKGNIESIYTHYDSYPENILPIIKKSFLKGKLVDDVIKRGDNAGLDADINKMNFYGGEIETATGSITNISKYLRDVANNGGAEFVYLWDEANKEWLMADIYGGNGELVPAFESLSVSVNESIQVEGKRDAKKVLTQYNNIFNKALVDFGAMPAESILGCIKYLFEMAMEDANFSREGFAISKNIKGSIKPLEIKMPGLGGHFIKVGATTIKTILDKYYSDLANAAGWGGIGIVEGTALYLEQIKQEAAGQSLLNAFNMSESLVIEGNQPHKEIEKAIKGMKGVSMDIKGDTIIVSNKAGGEFIYSMNDKVAEADITMSLKSLESMLKSHDWHYDKSDSNRTWDRGNRAEQMIKTTMKSLGLEGMSKEAMKLYKKYAPDGYTITLEESVVNEAEIKSDDEFKEYAFNVLKKAFGADFDEAKAGEVVNGILKKCDGDYGACVGMLTSSLGESVTNEAIDTKYWADYNTDTSGQGNKEFAEKSKDFEDTFSLAVAEWNDEADGAENRIIGSQVDKVKKIAQQFFKKEGYISVNIAQAMIAQKS